jgi:hypothetical protein
VKGTEGKWSVAPSMHMHTYSDGGVGTMRNTLQGMRAGATAFPNVPKVLIEQSGVTCVSTRVTVDCTDHTSNFAAEP